LLEFRPTLVQLIQERLKPRLHRVPGRFVEAGR
jgi:hypothetical protein